MERQKYFIIAFFVFTVFVSPVLASWKTEIYNAYINNKMEQWKLTIDRMEQMKKSDNNFLLELVNYQYGYIGWCIGTDNSNSAKEYLKLAEQNIEILEKNNANASIISAYKAAFYGYKIGLSKYKAPVLGPLSVKYSKLSMEEDKENPMGYIQYANGQFHMPPVFGGSKAVAIEYFQKAEKLMETDTLQIKNDWNYLNLLALIGQSFAIMKDYENAKKYYDKALAAEPAFMWVKNELLPELTKQINNK